MQRFFNTEGPCEPEFHYMVRLDDRLDQIKRLYIDRADSMARQQLCVRLRDICKRIIMLFPWIFRESAQRNLATSIHLSGHFCGCLRRRLRTAGQAWRK